MPLGIPAPGAAGAAAGGAAAWGAPGSGTARSGGGVADHPVEDPQVMVVHQLVPAAAGGGRGLPGGAAAGEFGRLHQKVQDWSRTRVARTSW